MKDLILQFFHNTPLMAAMVSTLIAQAVKVIINLIVYKKFDARLLFETGGMPSSHTACVGALWTSIVVIYGMDSPLSAIAFVLGGIVYRDAIGVRRQAGIHAKILNEITKYEESDEHDLYLKPLKTLLGHTPTQALVGLAQGFLVGVLYAKFI